MSADGQGMTEARRNSGRDMTGAVNRWPGIADLPAVVARAVARAVARPMDYRGRLKSRLTAG